MENLKRVLQEEVKNRLGGTMVFHVNEKNFDRVFQGVVTQVLTELVGADNIRAYGIKFTSGSTDFDLYAANAESE